jgi:hypothetical protein
MILINFSHPITATQREAIGALAGRPIERVLDIKTQFDAAQPFVPQAQALFAAVELTAEEWQTLPLLINLPSLTVIAALLLAEIHGRCGYFPAVLRLRPITGTTPPQFEAAEILNLQVVRDAAREWR